VPAHLQSLYGPYPHFDTDVVANGVREARMDDGQLKSVEGYATARKRLRLE
jgi:hypothetical protein